MNRTIIAFTAALLLLPLAVSHAADRRPNILIFYVDDMG
jgi:hypothetical protein